MVSVEQVKLNFGGFDLFKGFSFKVNPRDRIGLTGKNGAGKSTLLKMIAGQLSPSAGSIVVPKDTIIGYLPQTMILNDTQTVYEEARLAFKELLKIEKKINKLNVEMATRTDYESDSYHDLIQRSTDLTDHFNLMGGHNYEADIEQTLTGLGFKRSDFTRQTTEFSGGWRMRIELTKLLLRKPDVFLLDEPTNHLDIESIQWLEDFLKNYNGAIVLVSHDRAFLDNVTTRTVEISLGQIYDYKANYSKYVELRAERREQQIAAYRNQQKTIQDTEDFINRFRYQATKAVQVQSRIKQLEKIERIEIDEEDNSRLNLKFPPAPHSGKIVVEAKNVSKSYGELEVLNNIDLYIEKGEKIAFVGKNGEGKTTLARIIMNELEYTGKMKIGHNVKIGYFAQNQANLLNGELTVFETIDHVAVGDVRTKIRDILGAFMFSGDEVDKKVKVLSGGERTRLAMIKLMLEPVNFLVMDEPTNHLDMRSKEILKQALINFTGTILLVSHDREFLDGLVNCVYEFRDKKIKQHPGGIYDFIRDRKIESLKELEQKQNSPKTGNIKKEVLSGDEPSFEEKKEINKNIKKTEKQVEELELEISKLESRMKEMDKELANPQNADQSLFSDYEKVKHKLEQTMYEWELSNEQLEEWQNKKTW
ncbi:MAG: ABC-F family ATP-binding cassette domain-containing protein [Prolixibacteraceae bacterium]|nr:ABC-F family ATP-binding cassette domain-containing protein [Prolixibacteraceae bacterium]MBN2649565.1 ABC-F family ATP-binding cassette domain-containing protein [Prolixibacteraceae bacterium]